MRKLGDILLDMEILLDEMAEEHELQMGDILSLVYSQLKVHNPNCIEVYEQDESNPVYYYGPKEGLK